MFGGGCVNFEKQVYIEMRVVVWVVGVYRYTYISAIALVFENPSAITIRGLSLYTVYHYTRFITIVDIRNTVWSCNLRGPMYIAIRIRQIMISHPIQLRGTLYCTIYNNLDRRQILIVVKRVLYKLSSELSSTP